MTKQVGAINSTMIKKENERITITIRPKDKELLESIMSIKKCKTYGKAFEYIIDNIYIALDNFLTNLFKK